MPMSRRKQGEDNREPILSKEEASKVEEELVLPPVPDIQGRDVVINAPVVRIGESVAVEDNTKGKK